jgi:Flp pilus assembly pilin Flp
MQLVIVILLRLPRLVRDKQAQDLIEYAMLAAFMAMVIAAMIPDTASSLSTLLSQVASQLAGAATGVDGTIGAGTSGS